MIDRVYAGPEVVGCACHGLPVTQETSTREFALCSDSHAESFSPGFMRFVARTPSDGDVMIAKLLEHKARTESDRALSSVGFRNGICDERAWIRQLAHGSEIARIEEMGPNQGGQELVAHKPHGQASYGFTSRQEL